MTSSIQKLDDNFPIYLIKNFYKIDDDIKNKLISIVLDCKKRNSVHGNVGSFLVDKDYNNIFENLYDQYDQTCNKFFGSYTRVDNEKAIWSYSSNKHQHGLIPGIIHNHLRTSTINSVYYLNIPNSVTIEKGSISFFLNEKVFTYKPENEDLIIFPNYLDHRINNYDDDEEWRISINMEIRCTESSDELFSRIKIT